MFLILGLRAYVRTLAMITLACRNGHVAAHRLVKVTRKVALFFVPLVPIGTKYYSVCAMCGLQMPWEKEMAEAAASQAATGALGGTSDPVAPPIDTYSPALGSMAGEGVVPPGWYPDPAGGGGLRYWDGRAWTEAVHEGPSA